MDKPFAITLNPGSSRANHTGAWRTERPVYVSGLPPCNDACPAGENIQQWLYHAEEGGLEAYEAAWRQIMTDNPFPAIMGRVCYRSCETACNRAQLDSAVGINSVERYLGDQAIAQGWPVYADNAPVAAAATGKRVLVVGAGPSGLSAAYHLTRLGHAVTIKDAGSQPGGMMRYGIPKYRLPRDVMDAEIDRILEMGVRLELNTTVTDILAQLTPAVGGHAGPGAFDAAFVAVGAHIGKRAYIPAGDSAKIMDAVSLLHQVEDGSPPLLGRRVAADRRIRGTVGRLPGPRARPGRRPGRPGRRARRDVLGRHRRCRPGPDDRAPGNLRRRRHGARRADRHRRHRPRQEGRPRHRRLAVRN